MALPPIPRVDPARARQNALATALGEQQFITGVEERKRLTKQRELSRTAVQSDESGLAARRELAGESPQAAADIITVLTNLSAPERAQAERRSKFIGKAALKILSARGTDKPAIYEAALNDAATQGFDVSSFPAQYSPDVEPQLQAILAQASTIGEQLQMTARADKRSDVAAKRAGREEEIVQLQAAKEDALARGDTRGAAEIGRRIKKLGDPTPGKTAFDTSQPTKANITTSQKIIDDGEFTLTITQELRDVISSKNLGAVGSVRELFQGIGQQLEATADTIVDMSIERGDDLNLGLLFTLDPDLSGQKLLENVLAYRLALANNPDGRISDPDFKAAQRSLGFDKVFTGAGDIIARLDTFDRLVRKQQDIAFKRLGTTRPPVPEPPTSDTGTLATDVPEGTETEPNKQGIIMRVVNGQWVQVP